MQASERVRDKVLITGAAGMLGQSVMRSLMRRRDFEIFAWTRRDVDLRNTAATSEHLEKLAPKYIIHCAAKVGGIQANIDFPADYLLQNIQIDSSLLASAQKAGVQNFVYVGSSCMYPKDFRQPLVEKDLLAAPLEETNEGYALSKIVGSRLSSYISRQFGLNFKTIIPSNLYGPGDNFDSFSSHLVAACLRKAIEAKQNSKAEVLVWGDGEARREFTYVDEVSDWLVDNLESISDWPEVMNLGLGIDFTVTEYHNFALQAVGHNARLVFDPDKPSGMLQKLMDSSFARKNHGWCPKISPLAGMHLTLKSLEDKE